MSKEKNFSHQKLPVRRQCRIAAMQFLYGWETGKTYGPTPLHEALRQFFEQVPGKTEEDPALSFADINELGNSREFYSFAEELIDGVIKNIDRIDTIISDATKNWQIERIARCDLAILRLAIFELLYRTDIPPVVSINEAIDLAKEFSTEDSHRFVNGVLDRVKASLTRPLREGI